MKTAATIIGYWRRLKQKSINLRGLFDKFEENVYKIVSVYSILLGFAYDTGKYVFDRYCKFLFNMFICKKVTHVLLTYGNKHCRAPNEK